MRAQGTAHGSPNFTMEGLGRQSTGNAKRKKAARGNGPHELSPMKSVERTPSANTNSNPLPMNQRA